MMNMGLEDGTPFSVTIIMGDDDWVLKSDNGASPRLVEFLK